MPGNIEGAYEKFQETVAMAVTLMDLERQYNNPPRLNEQTAVTGLRGAAAVLMVAAFEAFLRQLFEEKLAVLTVHPQRVQFEQLPRKMQENSVFGTLERAMKGPPFEEPPPRFDRLGDIDKALRLVMSRVVNPAAFTETAGNPSSKRVREMFKAVGIGDVFAVTRSRFETQWGRPEATDFVSNKLDEVVRRRHNVAHTADALSISRSELRDAIKFLRVLSQVLEEELDTYISRLLT